MHRLIVTSTTYRQSSQRNEALAASDPENRLLSHMPLRRLEAEVLRDSLLSVAGQLDKRPFGPPDEVDVRGDGLVTARNSAHGGRRSIYVLHRRTKMPTILENFDSPQMGPNCIERGESIVAPQALHLLNNASVHDLARHFAERIQQEAGDDQRQQIARVYELALGRAPNPQELHVAEETMEQVRLEWLGTLGSRSDAAQEASKRALQNYCHAIMNSAGFVYVD